MPEQGEYQNFQDVMALEELIDGQIHPVSVNGQSLVLIRHGNDVKALGGKCPHKGAPMEQGAYCHSSTHGDVLVCPWHKAVFSATSGEVVEPISFEALPRYPVAVAEGRVLVGTVPVVVPAPVLRRAHERVLILGAGAAGVSTAFALRQAGFAGVITLVSEEAELPYDRTALSKTVLVSEASRAAAPLLLDEGFYVDQVIERLHGRVTMVDPSSRVVTLEDGQSFQGDHVVIATGGHARRPDVPGIGLEGVLSLRTQRDAQHMAEAITPDQVVVVIGGGLIALEVASSLRQKGVGVTIISSDEVPMEEPFGREVGLRLRQLHEENSVAFINDAAVACLYGEKRVEGVELDDGTRLPCAHVLVAVGIIPQSGFISGVMKGPDGNILVDESMRVQPLQAKQHYAGLYAAGDVSALERDGRIWRVEHWRHAEVEGRIVAQDIMGYRPEEMPMPWFWTQQFGKRLEFLGWGEAFDRVVVKGDLRSFNFIAAYILKERVVALAGAGHAADMARAAVDFERFVEEEMASVIL